MYTYEWHDGYWCWLIYLDKTWTGIAFFTDEERDAKALCDEKNAAWAKH